MWYVNILNWSAVVYGTWVQSSGLGNSLKCMWHLIFFFLPYSYWLSFLCVILIELNHCHLQHLNGSIGSKGNQMRLNGIFKLVIVIEHTWYFEKAFLISYPDDLR